MYDIDNQHKFQEVEQKIVELKTIQGPVYPGVDREHNYFAELEQSWAHLKRIANPFCEVETKHSYMDLRDKVDGLQELNYPVRQGVDYSHHYNIVQDKVVGLKTLSGNFPSFIRTQ